MSSNKQELRTVRGAQLRAEQSASTGKRVVRGRAASYGVHTVIGAGSRGAFREVILPGAFKAALARGDQARLNLNHSSDLVFGRVGRNLTLREAKDGLYFECALLEGSTAANELYTNLRAGLFDSCSFAFKVDEQNWNDDAPCDCCGENSKLPLRELASVRLFDVAVVDRPQYVGTSAAAGTVVEDLSAKSNADDDDDPEGTDWLEQSSARVSIEARSRAEAIIAKRSTPRRSDAAWLAEAQRKLAEIDGAWMANAQRRLKQAEQAIRVSDTVGDLGLESQAARDLAFNEDVRITKRNARYLRHPHTFEGTATEYLTWLQDFLRS